MFKFKLYKYILKAVKDTNLYAEIGQAFYRKVFADK
jgi:hypothetical protein